MSTSRIVLIAGVALLFAIIGLLPLTRSIIVTLTGKYLAKRKLAWVSLIACSLCVAMVLVVLSVMSGWLQMFRASFKQMSGDIIVMRQSFRGFSEYEEMIRRAKELPEVEAGVPIIRTAGLLTLPNNWNKYVGVVGIPIEEIDAVTQFQNTLWIQNGKDSEAHTLKLPERDPSFALWPGIDYTQITPDDKQTMRRQGMIVSSSAIDLDKDPVTKKPNWPTFLVDNLWAKLTVMPATDDIGAGSSTINARTTPYFIVDGSHTQALPHQNMVYVDFNQLQRDMNLAQVTYDEEVFVDPSDPKSPTTQKSVTEPGRTTEIQFKLKPGSDLQASKARIQAIVDDVSKQKETNFAPIKAMTWEEQQSTFLNAVENEITIMMTLFGLISLVAVFMIFCIFYTIVAEKTRDIGILKSVGASEWNIAQIFLTYGATIGFVGGGLGVLLGWGFVTWINEIQALITAVTGRSIYNSDVYQLERLPDTIQWGSAIVIWVFAVIAAIVGALVPAIVAARKRPVESLRFE